ncbi:hypothetical protein CW304_32815 [Bacillus sp. UFRGS-B20]|nr:hypothetical protein CW304_32815 [Bacillus sp. UFRGS-B20]
MIVSFELFLCNLVFPSLHTVSKHCSGIKKNFSCSFPDWKTSFVDLLLTGLLHSCNSLFIVPFSIFVLC